MKIPFAVLRFPPAQKQEWGIQFVRMIERNRERQMWALVLKSQSGFISHFGHLDGIEQVSPRTSVEILPYVMGSAHSLAEPVGLQKSPDYSGSVGLDLKFRPSSEWTIDATFNPDFGQVEAAPAVLNLTTFETFYPERRPFFVEGSQILHFTTFGGEFGPGLYYSRRIRKALSVDAPTGGYVLEDPRFATIIGAAKVSGRMANGFSVGIPRPRHCRCRRQRNEQAPSSAQSVVPLVSQTETVWAADEVPGRGSVRAARRVRAA